MAPAKGFPEKVLSNQVKIRRSLDASPEERQRSRKACPIKSCAFEMASGDPRMVMVKSRSKDRKSVSWPKNLGIWLKIMTAY